MSSQPRNSYPIDGINLREIKYRDVILADDKNNMNEACKVIKSKLDELYEAVLK